MNKTKFHLLNVAGEMGCPKCGFIEDVELLCPENISQITDAPAFTICWQCHYVGQIAVGAVRRTTTRALDEGDSSAPEGDTSPEVLSAGEAGSTPALHQ